MRPEVRRRGGEVKVPPPVLAGMAFAAQHVLARHRRPSAWSTAGAVALVGSSAALGVGALRQFRRSGTTVDPVRVERARALVTTGPYTLTRNPMYLGLLGVLTAHAVWRRSAPALLPVAAVAWALDRRQVPAEERVLAAQLEGYADYVARVPRWL